MKRNLFTALMMIIIMTLITGIVYPLATTGIAQVIFPDKANGSMAYVDQQPVGSVLIGQQFNDPRYFHGRPSAAGQGYDAASSSGSNLGPTNQKLLDDIAGRVDEIRRQNGLSNDAAIPADLVTNSASGLDPHISPASAYLQVERVAGARQVPVETVKKAVYVCTEERQWGFLGESRVNVLKLNMMLDQMTR